MTEDVELWIKVTGESRGYNWSTYHGEGYDGR